MGTDRIRLAFRRPAKSAYYSDRLLEAAIYAVGGVAAAIKDDRGVADREMQRFGRAFVWLRSFSLSPPISVSFGLELVLFWARHQPQTGDPDAGEAALSPIRSGLAPIADTIARKPFITHQTMLDAGVPFGRGCYWKSNNFDRVDDGLSEALLTSAPRITSPFSAIMAMRRIFRSRMGFRGSRIIVL